MLSKLTLSILCENRVVNPDLMAEQGLSILVTTSEGKLLFDTGQTGTLLHNASRMNINLKQVRKVVLSHGHFDMTGGLRYLLQEVTPLEVYCHPNLFNNKYKVREDNERVEIGVPWEKAELEGMGAKFILKTHPKEIMKDVWISGEIPRHTSYEYIDETYQERVLESFIHDELHDDLALIVNTVKGLVILLGCGHSGPMNTIKHAMRITGNSKVHAVVGGMHLHRAPQEKIDQITYHLVQLNPDYVIPLHCCGFRCINQLYNLLTQRVLLYNVGDSFTLN
jgi:7,8-dihydropterin-6-yl-methyl-4-(beta-D-ribofuranosyl)aminobenzene 5'-phosphate synthase